MTRLIKGKICIPSRSVKGKFYVYDSKTLQPEVPCLGFFFRKTCWHYKEAMRFVQSSDCVNISSQVVSHKYPRMKQDPFILNCDTHGY